MVPVPPNFRPHLGQRKIGFATTGGGREAWLHECPGLDPLVDQCVVMLRVAPIPERLKDAGIDALHASKAAHGERNRVVHDIWLPSRIEDGAIDPESFTRHQLRAYRPPYILLNLAGPVCLFSGPAQV